jgi:hypothetical protein
MKNLMRTIALLIIIVSTCGIVTAQTVLPKKCYMHLTGNIDKTIPVEMNLVRINDTIYGNFTVSGDAKSAGMVDRNFKSVGGKVKADGSFVLTEILGQQGVVLTGKFLNAQTLKGTIETGKGASKQNFELAEKYPEGTIPMSLSYQKASAPLVKKPKSPIAKIEMALLVPSESSNSVISDTVKKIILEKFTGKQVKTPNAKPDMILASMKQVYFENYVTTNEDIYNAMPGASFNWESIKFMDITFNSSWYLCFSIDHYAFTGGAHGLENEDYVVINTRTGKTIEFTDIFTAEAMEGLTHVITDKIKERNNLPLSSRLTDNGFFVDEVKPSSNFFITSKGIGFHYNPYEYAPYYYGSTDIFLEYDEISKFIRGDSFVKTIMK